MPEVDKENPTDVDRRIARLESRVRRLTAGVLMLVVLGAVAFLSDRRSFVTRYLFTREFNVPPPSQWSAVSVSGGLAPAIDGKSITFWLAGGPFSKAHHQTRIELDDGGGQHIELIDQNGKARLRLATAVDGTPSIVLFGSDGKPTWAVPEVLSK
jgi:hypothetical protein